MKYASLLFPENLLHNSGQIDARKKAESRWIQKAAYLGLETKLVEALRAGLPTHKTLEALLPRLEKAAKQGSPEQQHTLGLWSLYNRKGEKALHYFTISAEKKFTYSEFALGHFYMDSPNNVVVKDLQKAHDYYLAPAKEGYKEAQYRLGWLYETYDKIKNPKKAFDYYNMAAEQNYPKALHQVAKCYENGFGVPKNPQKSLEYYQKAADKGIVDAALKIAQYYRRQIKVRDTNTKYYENDEALENAITYYSKVTSQGGNAATHRTLGELWYKKYFDARQCQFPPDLKEPLNNAVHYYFNAAKQGDAMSQDMIGHFYKTGTGINPSEDNAFYWSKKAAEQGIVTAQKRLAGHYWQGKGINKDLSQSYRWTAQAANQNDPEAIYSLGQYYEFGYGIASNLTTAEQCYNAAKQLGYRQADAALLRCKKKMTNQPALQPSTRAPQNPPTVLQRTQQPVNHTNPTLLNHVQTNSPQYATVVPVSRAHQKKTGPNFIPGNAIRPFVIPPNVRQFPQNLFTSSAPTLTQSTVQQPQQNSATKPIQAPVIQKQAPKKVTTHSGASQPSAKRPRPNAQTLVQSDLPKEPEQKKVKTESTPIQRIERVSSIDEDTLLEIVKTLRGTSHAKNNCIRYVDALLRYFMTSEIPTAQVKGCRAPLKYFHVRCYDHSVTVKSEVPQQRPEVRACEIPNGLQFGHTFHHATPQVSNTDNKPMIELGKPYVIDLDAPTKLVNVPHDALNSYLMEQAERAPGNFVFGYIGLPRCGQHLEEPGHGIAYYATPNKVIYIDCQPLLQNKKTHMWEGTPIFHHLAYDNKKKTGYHFVTGDNHEPGRNEFQPEVFTAPLWPVPGVHYTPHEEHVSQFTQKR